MYQTALLRREQVAEGTIAFHFTKPAGFAHQAGQNAVFTLADLPETDSEGPSRTFSIASAPHEPELMIAMRMRDTAFKRALNAAAPGTQVRVDGPGGTMMLHEDATRPAVFLAGGIGVTPFLSMTRHAAKNCLPHRITQFYSNRRQEDAAFLDELQATEHGNPNYRLIATLTKAEKSSRPWKGETGVIGPEMIGRYLSNLKGPIYYVAGPRDMTLSMELMLGGAGVDENDIYSEEFYGY